MQTAYPFQLLQKRTFSSGIRYTTKCPTRKNTIKYIRACAGENHYYIRITGSLWVWQFCLGNLVVGLSIKKTHPRTGIRAVKIVQGILLNNIQCQLRKSTQIEMVCAMSPRND